MNICAMLQYVANICGSARYTYSSKYIELRSNEEIFQS